MALSDLLVNTVSVATMAYANVNGVSTATPTTATRRANVQPMTARERVAYGVEGSETAYLVYFGADPGVKAGDTVTWGATVLRVLGPASNMVGRSVGWLVPCQAVR